MDTCVRYYKGYFNLPNWWKWNDEPSTQSWEKNIMVALSKQREGSWIFVTTSLIFWILQQTSIWQTQLSNFSAFTSPLYIGNSNLTLILSKGEWECHFSNLWGVCLGLKELKKEVSMEVNLEVKELVEVEDFCHHHHYLLVDFKFIQKYH